jgi:hypothetical protein
VGPQGESIDFDGDLHQLRGIRDELAANPLPRFQGGLDSRTFESALRSSRRWAAISTVAFGELFDRLGIVNPSSTKFESTVLMRVYYDQLRILSNELERTNTSLVCLGFSFEDAHIREIVTRAADGNPTLTVFVFAFDTAAARRLGELLRLAERRNRNILVVEPNTDLEDDVEGVKPWTLDELTRAVLMPNVSINFTSTP